MQRDELRYLAHHPFSRLGVVLVSMQIGLLSYAVDPLSVAVSRPSIPIIGGYLSMSAKAIDGFLLYSIALIFAVGVGVAAGDELHRFLRDRMKLTAFGHINRKDMLFEEAASYSAERSQGRLAMRLVSSFACVWLSSHLMLFMCNASALAFECVKSDELPFSYGVYTRLCAVSTWGLDFLSVVLLIDSMANEATVSIKDRSSPMSTTLLSKGSWYRFSCQKVFFNYMQRRDSWLMHTAITLCLIAINLLSCVIFHLIVSPAWGHFSEIHRVFLGSLRLFLDVSYVVQDWEFPHFNQIRKVSFGVGDSHFTGKWLNFGVLSLTALIDLNSVRYHIAYSPMRYRQSVSDFGVVVGHDSHSAFLGYSLLAKMVATFPVALAFVFFVWGVRANTDGTAKTPPLSFQRSFSELPHTIEI